MTDTAQRNTPADKRRGDAILATMQAQRAHRADALASTGASVHVQFDEAHAIVDALVAGRFITLEQAA